MRHEAPAAFPLLGFACGLTAAPFLVAPVWDALLLLSLVVVATPIWRRGPGKLSLIAALLALAAGILAADHLHEVNRTELQAFSRLAPDRFIEIDAPLDHDWSPRGSGYLLRVDRFRAAGQPFNQPLYIYAPFCPAGIEFFEHLHAEGLLRRNDEGRFFLTVKSKQLLFYSQPLAPWSPRRWNRALAARLAPLAAHYPVEEALVEALALGRNEHLTPEVRASFRRGGTYHLLVFSGLQIALAAGVLTWLLRWLHAPRASDWLLLLFALAAPLFIGPTASVSRASIGLGLYAASRILKRPTSLENLWCVAALARLVIAPSDLGDAAFQLTYAGAGAMLFMARRKPWIAPMTAELAIIPLTLFHFHQFALGGSLLTLLMSPLILAMLGAAVLVLLWPPAIHAVTALHAACAFLNDWGSTAAGYWKAPPQQAMIVGYGAALLAVAFLTGTRRSVAIALGCLLPTTLVLVPRPEPPAEIIALDVGQGDSLVVLADSHAILIDGGGRSGSEQFGESTLLPLLVDRGIRRFDAVVITHAHPDHCGGIPAVIENLQSAEIWINPRRFAGDCAASVLEATRRSETPIHLVHDGDRLPLGPIHATAILAGGSFRKSAENNSSTVLRIQIGSQRLLLTGDIERDAEARLEGRVGRCDILKVAHHGSRSSSTAPFLDATRPRLALISAGRHNLFGHPHSGVLEALKSRGVRIWRTDLRGSVTVEILDHQLRAHGQIDTSE